MACSLDATWHGPGWIMDLPDLPAQIHEFIPWNVDELLMRVIANQECYSWINEWLEHNMQEPR